MPQGFCFENTVSIPVLYIYFCHSSDTRPQTPALNAAVVATLQQLMQFQERALDRETSGGGGGAGGGGAASGKTLAAKKKRVVWHHGTRTVD
jgi:hypothetical protein